MLPLYLMIAVSLVVLFLAVVGSNTTKSNSDH
jgi:hypothetical protein